MSYDIDQIFRMLSWNSDVETQQKGILAAAEITHLSVLIQPIEDKSVWENCAKVISKKTDDQLSIYLIPLLEWLKDLTWPGADIIFHRLETLSIDYTHPAYIYCLDMAHQTKDTAWLKALQSLQLKHM